MDITVLGTGMVGAPIAEEAVRRGHTVTAATHSGTTTVANVATVQLDLTDTAAVRSQIAHSDVTIIATGNRKDLNATVEAHRALVAAGFSKRLIVVGGAGSLLIDGKRLVDDPNFPPEYLEEGRAFSEVLDIYRTSKDDWTLVSPSPEIAPGEATGNIVLGGDSPAGDAVTTGDFAVGILNEVEDPHYRLARFTIATQKV